jgi:hypothetical protein
LRELNNDFNFAPSTFDTTLASVIGKLLTVSLTELVVLI